MVKIKNFYDLEAWKESHKLVLEVYKITKEFPKEEMYGLVSQLRRSASSITANTKVYGSSQMRNRSSRIVYI